ncbi:hypothetical protein OG594_45575 [Streptomyces sp. NBC_01214]|uniref:hypothetical protein n=1 Tax=Streptomyces sp. NBC_01214 TaxID=2903777 RepID=UPI00224FA5BA|nr:hypothetical protein [Streptomyces sp. NBC_01214]MCX4808748.1 hypothetical protein [Streptomyces sp. NBC_01214]
MPARALIALAITTALACATGCTPGSSSSSATASASATASPSPTFSGPGYDAYLAGHSYGKRNEKVAQLPAGEAAENKDGTLTGALTADQTNAKTWCVKNLPSALRTEHRAYLKSLLGGCIDGVLPTYLSPNDPSLYL